MKPRSFAYHRPRTVEEALDLIADEDDVAVLAGGQSLVPMMNVRLATPATVIDINRIEGLCDIGIEDEHLVVGALVRHEGLARHPLSKERVPILARMAASIGHWAIRTRGTFGGSLVHADPAAQWPLAALLLEAEIELVSRRGTRRVAASEFFEGALATVRAPDELLTRVRLRPPAAGHRFGFRLLARRPGDYAIAMAACIAEPGRSRLAIGGVEPVPLDRSAALAGLGPESGTIAAATEAACRDLSPMEDPRAPADHRRRVLPHLVSACLADALSEQAA